jgi:primosomal protein N' (replication factor Y)
VVELAARHDVEAFLAGELERRSELRYPPFARLVRVLVTAPDQATADGIIALLVETAEPVLGDDLLLGPAPLFRLRDRSRSHLLVKTGDPRRSATVFRGLLRDLAADLRRAGATAVVDVDPQSFN